MTDGARTPIVAAFEEHRTLIPETGANLAAGAQCRSLPIAEPATPTTFATLTAALQVIATADIRNLPPAVPHFEPFQCHRCLDLKTVPDWANWSPAWLWQRYRPVPHVPCPDCAQTAPTTARREEST